MYADLLYDFYEGDLKDEKDQHAFLYPGLCPAAGHSGPGLHQALQEVNSSSASTIFYFLSGQGVPLCEAALPSLNSSPMAAWTAARKESHGKETDSR